SGGTEPVIRSIAGGKTSSGNAKGVGEWSLGWSSLIGTIVPHRCDPRTLLSAPAVAGAPEGHAKVHPRYLTAAASSTSRATGASPLLSASAVAGAPVAHAKVYPGYLTGAASSIGRAAGS